MSKNLPALVISGITISQDADGRFSLNDLHKAAGAADKDKPGHFLNNDQTQGLIAQILSDGGIPPSVTIKGGKNQGSWVAKELVYRYAMWISPAFELKVIRAYDALATSASSVGVSVEVMIEQAMPMLLQRMGGVVKAISTKQHEESEARMAQQFAIAIAANREEFDLKLKEVIAGGVIAIRHGKTAGQLWADYKLPAIKNASIWFGNRLTELACRIDGEGCSESGGVKSKLFDPDKVAVAMKNGLLGYAKQYAQQRLGQAPLFPKAA